MILSVAILIFTIVNFLMLVWLLMVLSNGLSFTNKNIDNLAAKNQLLVVKADEVIGKYKRMMIDIENIK